MIIYFLLSCFEKKKNNLEPKPVPIIEAKVSKNPQREFKTTSSKSSRTFAPRSNSNVEESAPPLIQENYEEEVNRTNERMLSSIKDIVIKELALNAEESKANDSFALTLEGEAKQKTLESKINELQKYFTNMDISLAKVKSSFWKNSTFKVEVSYTLNRQSSQDLLSYLEEVILKKQPRGSTRVTFSATDELSKKEIYIEDIDGIPAFLFEADSITDEVQQKYPSVKQGIVLKGDSTFEGIIYLIGGKL